jgi:hypothetical protein
MMYEHALKPNIKAIWKEIQQINNLHIDTSISDLQLDFEFNLSGSGQDSNGAYTI